LGIATQAVLALQEGTLLAARSLGGVWRGPRYAADAVRQMDAIGWGSASIVLLTGFFTGAALCVQTYPSMKDFGAQNQTGQLVALALLRELGPVITALMVAGRVGSAIAAELGSMVVSEQIDVLRALGVDPLRKLVAPRLAALLTTLPMLTLISTAAGIVGGGAVATALYGQPMETFVASVLCGIEAEDVAAGLAKPLVFALIVGTVACREGLKTTRRDRRGRRRDDALGRAFVNPRHQPAACRVCRRGSYRDRRARQAPPWTAVWRRRPC
jgi:phospholipid/cholesterol/gamma-HCH transport system permease protein